MNHVRLSTLSAEEQRVEIAESLTRLREVSGQTVDCFAYPYGSLLDYTAESMAICEETGCRIACSNRYGPVRAEDGPYAFRRVTIDRSDHLTQFIAKVTGKLDALALQDSAAAMRLRRMLS